MRNRSSIVAIVAHSLFVHTCEAAYAPNVVLTDDKWQRFLASKQNQNKSKNLQGGGKRSNILGHKSIPRIGGRSNLFVSSRDKDIKNGKGKRRIIFRNRETTTKNTTDNNSGILLNSMQRQHQQQQENDEKGEEELQIQQTEDNHPNMDVMTRYGSAIAGVFTLAIIAGLAINGDDQGVEEITETVFTSYMPSSLPEILSVALGEGIAGFFGALFAYVASTFRAKGEDAAPALTENEVLADTEYFFVRSIAKPLLVTTGLPIEFVDVLSVIVASANSELIKFSKALLPRLINARNSNNPDQIGTADNDNNNGEQLSDDDDDASDPTKYNDEVQFDVVDLFSDIVKWLEYDALSTDFGTDFSSFVPNVSFLSNDITEGLTFGAIASLSSALYADLLYRYTDYGDPRAKLASSTRSSKARIERYISKSITGAAVFGVYEGASGPLSNWFTGLLSGGMDGCVGSDNFDMCMEVYMLLNEPGATSEAQFRSLFTAIYGLSERLGVFADVLDAFTEQNLVLGNTEYARGVLVTVYSMIHNNAPFVEELFQFSII